MCGIVGYIGKREAYPVLIEGLSALEYRGYDSAGIALVDKGNILVWKNKGKVEQLRAIADKKAKNSSTIGIAHTRWATHGVPSQANAHPHTDAANKIALVHNGIIENYAALKEKLKKEGVAFKSETDTEVLAQLVGKYYKGDLVEAVSHALAEVDGTFGIAVIAKDNPDVLVGARRGSPLVVGVGDGEYFLASTAATSSLLSCRPKPSSLMIACREM
jgi:glucosamine--fructose-6-phosphate aminotransferase (isomerizing)